MSIKNKLLLNPVFIIFILCFFSGLMLYAEKHIQILNKVALLSEELNTHLMELKVHEYGFLYKNDRAHLTQYEAIEQKAEDKKVELIKAFYAIDFEAKSILSLKDKLATHKDAFHELITLKNAYGLSIAEGLVHSLEKSATAVKEQLAKKQDNDLLYSFTKLESLEKNYLLSKSDRLINEITSHITQFEQALKSLKQQDSALVTLFANYKSLMNNVIDADKEIATKFKQISTLEDSMSRDALNLASEIKSNISEFENSLFTSLFIFFIAFFIISLLFSFTLNRSIITPLTKLKNSLKSIEKFDFTQGIDIPEKKRDELIDISMIINATIKRFNKVLCEIERTGFHIKQSSHQISLFSKEVQAISEQQSQYSTDVAEVTKLLHSNASSTLDHATGTKEKSQNTLSKAEEGHMYSLKSIDKSNTISTILLDSTKDMKELESSTEQINGILDTISLIAEQTNLLALNAAIEAARAGETGRGFAVVADEVRSLATRTESSADEVKHIINKLVEKVDNVSAGMTRLEQEVSENQALTNKTSELFAQVESDAKDTDRLNGLIMSESNNQLEKCNEQENKLDVLFNAIKGSNTKLSNTSNISDSLLSLTASLDSSMQDFNFIRDDNNNDYTGHEKRNAKRYTGNLITTIDYNGLSAEGLTKDISETGLKVVLTSPLEANTLCDVTLRTPTSNHINNLPEAFSVKARVVSCSQIEGDKNYIHFEFSSLDSQSKSLLKKCVEIFKSV
ncbi:methyl-accepting chemotaxis protein [Marinomonas sp. C2222]|uniref:Methyl-accepting chemotaxis protein n=1 Tax=Marinomonas sargassi TaxID=2984494 RepID=A0ABT2YTL0_9GAMM|nr:methyl-accepting chemotaxis protein [Marinomonas sargassi]MCV2403231.1 methyl-accepting chemotaxis protein [Marinomonas sargassi]